MAETNKTGNKIVFVLVAAGVGYGVYALGKSQGWWGGGGSINYTLPACLTGSSQQTVTDTEANMKQKVIKRLHDIHVELSAYMTAHNLTEYDPNDPNMANFHVQAQCVRQWAYDNKLGKFVYNSYGGYYEIEIDGVRY